MGQSVKGDVVVLNFPFSDLSQTKRRPPWFWHRWPVMTRSSARSPARRRPTPYSVAFEAADFAAGGLNQSSRIRPNRLFTADEGIILYRAGHISTAKLTEVVNRLIKILKQA